MWYRDLSSRTSTMPFSARDGTEFFLEAGLVFLDRSYCSTLTALFDCSHRVNSRCVFRIWQYNKNRAD